MKVICIKKDNVWYSNRRDAVLGPVEGEIYTVVRSLKKGEVIDSQIAPFDCYELDEFPPKDHFFVKWFAASHFRPLDQTTDMAEPSEQELAELAETLFEEQFQNADYETAN
jgi:hypothetical protein